jgi:hypothetical protein
MWDIKANGWIHGFHQEMGGIESMVESDGGVEVGNGEPQEREREVKYESLHLPPIKNHINDSLMSP